MKLYMVKKGVGVRVRGRNMVIILLAIIFVFILSPITVSAFSFDNLFNKLFGRQSDSKTDITGFAPQVGTAYSIGPICNDSDSNSTYPNGLNYYKKGLADGRVNGIGSWYEDICLYLNQTGPRSWQYVRVDGCSGSNCNLQEGYCSGTSVTNIAYKCPYGCTGAACAPRCVDNDNGKNYSIKASTIGTWNMYRNSEIFVQANQTDLCGKDVYPVGSEQYIRYKDRLYEYFCTSDGYFDSETYICPSGKCDNGACASIEIIPVSSILLADLKINNLDSNLTVDFNSPLILSWNFTGADYCSLNTTEVYLSDGTPFDSKHLTENSGNITLYARPLNELTNLLEFGIYCLNNSLNTSAKDTIFVNINASTCTDSDASEIYPNGLNFNMRGNVLDYSGSLHSDSCLLLNATKPGKEQFVITRYCFGLNCTLQENYCSNGVRANLLFNCTGGCLDGVCSNIDQTCKDGTLYGQCMQAKPNYCYFGNSIAKCSVCGCNEGERCINSTEFCEQIFDSVNFESIETPLDFDLVYPRGQLINLYPLGSGFELMKEAIYEISINNSVIFRRNADCEQEECLITTWEANQGILIGRNNYLVNITLIDQEGLSFNKEEVFSIEFKEIDSTLCNELITGHNNASADRANVIFVGFFDEVMGAEWLCGDALQTFCADTYSVGKIVANLVSTNATTNSITFYCENQEDGFRSLNYTKSLTELSNYDSRCEQIQDTREEVLKKISEYFLDLDGNNKGLFSIEPFKSNVNRFNFWYVNKTQSLDYCSKPEGGWGEASCEDPTLDANCLLPNKYVTFIIDNSFRSNAGPPIMLSSPLAQNTSPYSVQATTFVHEFGHQFGVLRDEYIEYPGSHHSYGTEDRFKNCYAGLQQTRDECLQNSQWKYFIGRGCGNESRIDCTEEDANYSLEIGCFEVCSYTEFGIFRPSFNSIMRCHGCEPFTFGPWNEKLINDVLQQFGDR